MICLVVGLSALDSLAQALALVTFMLKSSLSRFLKSCVGHMYESYAYTGRNATKESDEKGNSRARMRNVR